MIFIFSFLFNFNLLFLILFMYYFWFLFINFEFINYFSYFEYCLFINGIKLLIIAELFLFAACFWYLFNFRIIVCGCILVIVIYFFTFSLGFAELLCLIASSILLNSGLAAIRLGFIRSFCINLLFVIGFSILFLCLFYFECFNSIILFNNYVFSCLFYFITYLHYNHVLLGWIINWLFVFIYFTNFTWLLCIDFFGVILMFSMYWHFVDIIWLIVFLLLFL